jgi:pimeloyl-ACP methyl ester carboxylesterase
MSRVSVHGVELAVSSEGRGEAVLLLHGVPDSRDLWRKIAPELVSAGYRVISFDQRGFGDSDAPSGTQHYKLPLIAEDALAVLDTLGIQKAHLVGHDWGAAVAWFLAGTRPERFHTLTALSAGHARAYAAAGFEQYRRAWYILVALMPRLGEWLVARRDYRLLKDVTRHAESERWVRDLSRPGRLTAALNWYRANSLSIAEHPRVQIPVLGVWSDEDFALTEAQMTGSAPYVDGPWRYERLEGVSHWLPLDAPDRTSRVLLEFFAQHASSH